MNAPPPVHVLIADDDALVGDIANAMLAAAGYAVETVRSGHAAMAACAVRMPDIVLLDVEMADGDGYLACSAIRRMPGGAHVPIVMVTGLDDPASVDRAYDLGATDFIVKPINWPLLVHRVRYVWRGARTLKALRSSEQQNEALIKAIPDGLYLLNGDGSIARRLQPIDCVDGGVNTDAPGGVGFVERLPAAVRHGAREALDRAIGGNPADFEFAREGPRIRHFECRYLPNPPDQALAIVRDVTGRKEAEAHIHRLAYFDALTALPNREWLTEYLAHVLATARAHDRTVALLYLDLDQFKRINDTLGHDTGDALLRQVAVRIAATLDVAVLGEAADASSRDALIMGDARPDASALVFSPDEGIACGCLARVGGDEFMAVLTGNPTPDAAERAARRILEGLAPAFRQGAHELVVTPSIGIALFPEHGADPQTLLKNADAAMYQAKAGGRNQLQVYSQAVNARAMYRLSLEMDLRRALEDSALEMYYQPKYDAQHLQVIGAEALLRWFHPERGQVSTAEFVAIAEETGLIGDLDRWVMSRVCRDLSRWRDAGLELPSIAVNISGRNFALAEALNRICATVAEAGLPPSTLELELTEGVLMRDADVGRRSLLALKEFGFKLAVDDFGTGYCSLSYLKRFPLDILKVDRSFIADVTVDADDAAIVRAIITLAHDLHLTVVAEGVATARQLEFLRAASCDAIQGFLMSPAVSAAAFTALLRAGGRAALRAEATSSVP